MAKTPAGVSPSDIAPTGGGGLPRGLRLRDLLLQIYLQQQKYRNQAFEPFLGFEREIGEQRAKFDPLVYESIVNPTASPSFQLNLKEGLDALGSQYAATGSSVSGPLQVAGARFAEGLAGDELDKANARLMAASQFRGILPTTQEPQFLGASVGGHNARAALINAMAASKASSGGGGGGFFSDLLGAGTGLLGGPEKALGMVGNLAGLNSRPEGVAGPLMENNTFFSNPLAPFLNMGSKLMNLWGKAGPMTDVPLLLPAAL